MVEFTLTYDGPLASNGDPKKKHAIREALHPQLKDLWTHPPLVHMRAECEPRGKRHVTVGEFNFTWVVGPHLFDRAALDVLMLRPELPGGILAAKGDIDNRLKTLFDALTRPAHSQDVPKDWVPSQDQEPLYCVFDDDRHVTDVRVHTDRLLAAPSPTHVKLIMKLTLGAGFAGGTPMVFG